MKQRFLVIALVLAMVASMAVPGFAKEITITGTIEKTDTGVVIKAEDGDYLVSGQDLSQAAGKMVKATGNVIESEGQKIIDVTQFEEVK